MKAFKLLNQMNYDITRPVADMAAFFGYFPGAAGEVSLRVLLQDSEVIAAMQAEDVAYTCSRRAENTSLSGELTRCVKLAVLDAFSKLTGLRPELPWGILSGVRPTKLAHKLLDSGSDPQEAVKHLADAYLLPEEQGGLLVSIAQKQKSLLPDKQRFNDAGIYIGIPFCPSRCSYCSFPSGIVPQDEESQQNFVNLIEQDIKNVVQLLSMHRLNVISLYIGGGTPTSLNDKVFAGLMELVRKHLLLPSVKEFTVEAGRPDCFSLNKLAAMEQAGVNRISVNPQTFHDKTLRLIGRRHTVEDFYRAYEMVRSSSIPTVNMDLIIGLPGETEQDIRFSLQRAAQLEAENLTLHTLTLKKSAPLFGNYSGLPAETAASLVKEGYLLAGRLGLEPYYLYRQHYMLGHLANIGYAKPGTESLYNIQMMEERHPVIGIGPASASKMPLEDGHHLHKLNMPKNISAYAANLTSLLQKRAQLFT